MIDKEKISSKNPKIKFAYAKQLVRESSKNPEAFLEDFDYILELTNEKNNIIKWTAIDLLGNLAPVLTDENTSKIIPMLRDFLLSGKLILSNHALSALGQILLHKPHFTDEIVPAFIALRNVEFDTEDCREISRSKLLEFLKENYRFIIGNKEARQYIEECTQSPRENVAKLAKSVLKKIKSTT